MTPPVRGRPGRFGFLLIEDFSTISFAAAIEPLRMANRLSGRDLYRFVILSADGRPVSASNGVRVLPDHGLDVPPGLDAVFVCGPTPVRRSGDEAVLAWLRRQAHDGVALGGLCTGSQVLARAGLLDGYRCTVHWENLQGLREACPELVLTTALYEIDRDRYSAGGGTAPMDMMLYLIARDQGEDLAAAISEQFACDRIRSHADRQRVPLRLRLGPGQPKLAEAVADGRRGAEVDFLYETLKRVVDADQLRPRALGPRVFYRSGPGLRIRFRTALHQSIQEPVRPAAAGGAADAAGSPGGAAMTLHP